MVRPMKKKKASATRPEQQRAGKKRCTKRDIIMGFWIGVAGAALYVNTKRQPVLKPNEAKVVERSVSKVTDPGLSKVPPATTTSASVTATAPPATTTNTAAVPPATETAPVGTALVAPRGTASAEAASETKTLPAGHRDFLQIARKSHTDKVAGANMLPGCLKDSATCARPTEDQPKCRVLQGHFYHTLYQRWLGPYSTDDAEPFQFLEIGHFKGNGFDAYKEFLPRAETHSIEIACIEHGPREEGKWPWPNFPADNKNYQHYLDTNQLHCGDGSDFNFLHETWTTKMKRPDAPPLKVVVEDASHLSDHMAKSLLFWFPRIAPGGILVVEDIQPISEANQFRTHVMPQVLKDLHYCGDPQWRDAPCFPTIWPLLQSIHCEMHICVFERNEIPAVEVGKEEATPPANTLNGIDCLFRRAGFP